MKLNLTQKKINYIFNLVFFKIKKKKEISFQTSSMFAKFIKKKKKII